ncbi:MAG: DUF1344 domain-containing protein [Pseudorhodobacter sp.]|nr:DUF1344 domain-containing protein [Pseudorhodobacter sp.]
MRNTIMSAVLIAATLGFGGAAMAQSAGTPLNDLVTTIDRVGQQTTGIVTHVDMTDHTVTLADGHVYLLPRGFNVGLLNDGQKVALNWNQIGGQMQVRSVQFSAS